MGDVQRDANGKVLLYNDQMVVTLVELKKDVNMEVEIGSGFNAGAQVSGFSIFYNSKGNKGTLIGTWNRGTPSFQPSTEVSVAAKGAAAILVTDTDTTVDEEMFFFSIQVTDGKLTYDTDPELKVKRNTGG